MRVRVGKKKLLMLKSLMTFTFCLPLIFSIEVTLLAELFIFAACLCANFCDASCPVAPLRVVMKGWCFFPIYILQCYENVSIKTYLGVLICTVSMI